MQSLIRKQDLNDNIKHVMTFENFNLKNHKMDIGYGVETNRKYNN